MNYYPNNLYTNYQPQPQIQIPQLYGKVVDSVDMVKSTEVPFGYFSVFPKGDLSEIYIKTWNNNGTTQINTYKVIASDEKEEVDTNARLLERIEAIEKKIDSISGLQKSNPIEKKEMKSSAY